MLVVGLTGASGSGKGYLCSLLAGPDICIIDTDKVYHGMISAPSPCVDALASAFGEGIRNTDGGIDRALLAGIVFSSADKLSQLNSITHGFIREECNRIIKKSGAKIVILDAPVLFESGFDRMCDVTVGVVADQEIRIGRIIDRDGITRERALNRIKNQHSDDWLRRNCDIIIENSYGDISAAAEDLKNRLTELYGSKEEEQKEKKQSCQ